MLEIKIKILDVLITTGAIKQEQMNLLQYVSIHTTIIFLDIIMYILIRLNMS